MPLKTAVLCSWGRHVLVVLQVTLTGRFAFVEFRMPEYATAALQLNGQIALMGNTLKIARPSSYVEPSQVGTLYDSAVLSVLASTWCHSSWHRNLPGCTVTCLAA